MSKWMMDGWTDGWMSGRIGYWWINERTIEWMGVTPKLAFCFREVSSSGMEGLYHSSVFCWTEIGRFRLSSRSDYPSSWESSRRHELHSQHSRNRWRPVVRENLSKCRIVVERLGRTSKKWKWRICANLLTSCNDESGQFAIKLIGWDPSPPLQSVSTDLCMDCYIWLAYNTMTSFLQLYAVRRLLVNLLTFSFNHNYSRDTPRWLPVEERIRPTYQGSIRWGQVGDDIG